MLVKMTLEIDVFPGGTVLDGEGGVGGVGGHVWSNRLFGFGFGFVLVGERDFQINLV